MSTIIHIASISLSSPLAPCFLTTPTTSVHSGALEVADKLELILTSITKLTHAQGKSWHYIYFSESSCRCHSVPPFPFPYRSITHGLHLEKVTFQMSGLCSSCWFRLEIHCPPRSSSPSWRDPRMSIHIPKDSGDSVSAWENAQSNDREGKPVLLLSSNYASRFRFRKCNVILN